MKRIAVFSDIHGNLQALESILKDIERSNVDEVICLGDIIGIGPSSKECLDIVMDSRIKMVKGNHEIYQIDEKYYNNATSEEIEHRKWVRNQLDDKEMDYIENLPMTYEELINGKLFTFTHFFLGDQYYQLLNILGDNRIFEVAKTVETDYMFFGHSHDSFQIDNGSLFTCVGSSGCRKNNITFYTIVEIEGKSVRITKKEIEFDREEFDKLMKKIDYPDIERIKPNFFGL